MVIAYDGSESARAALDAAARLFPGRAAAVVSVWEPVDQVASASLVALPAGVAREACERLDSAAEAQAARLAGEGADRLRSSGIDATAQALRCERNVWSTIVSFVDQGDAEVVVVGARGRSGIASVLLGSVSTGVVHHCRRPVLVVHG